MKQLKLLSVISFTLATSGYMPLNAGWFDWRGNEQTELGSENENQEIMRLRKENADLRQENTKLRKQLRACKNREDDRQYGMN
jgi:hypothetical protein